MIKPNVLANRIAAIIAVAVLMIALVAAKLRKNNIRAKI